MRASSKRRVTSSLNRTAPAQAHDRRVQPRFTAQFRGTVSGRRGEGQGRTLDVSIGGCKLESPIAFAVGDVLECRLHVPGLDWPLRIDEVTVRWVDGHLCGLAFTHISDEEQAKLTRVLAELEQEA